MEKRSSFRKGVGLAILAGLGLAVFVDRPAAAGPSAADAGGAPGIGRLVLELPPGPEYRKPQIAAWLETPAGGYVGTLYSTARTARNSWILAPREGRPEALPVWTHARGGAVDAVASPTPAQGLSREAALPAGLSPGRYVVWLEVNRSFDYNEAYPKSRGVNGQPSLVYRAEIEIGKGKRRVPLEPVGTGSPDGSDGKVRPGLEGITTARDILTSPAVTVEAE